MSCSLAHMPLMLYSIVCSIFCNFAYIPLLSVVFYTFQAVNPPSLRAFHPLSLFLWCCCQQLCSNKLKVCCKLRRNPLTALLIHSLRWFGLSHIYILVICHRKYNLCPDIHFTWSIWLRMHTLVDINFPLKFLLIVLTAFDLCGDELLNFYLLLKLFHSVTSIFLVTWNVFNSVLICTNNRDG